MRRALQVLLSEVIDYAGLFPPAKLDVPTSVDNYLRYFHGPQKWILGRFVCSSGKLPELARELAEHPEEPFIPVTVIGQASMSNQHCPHLDLPFKLTAGLHHPLPQKDQATGGEMQGFLNILVALALIQAHELNRSEIEEVLAETDPAAFKFTDDDLEYKG